MQIIRSENGTKEHVVDINHIDVPDIYNIAMDQDDEYIKDMLLECWHLACDMRGALKAIQYHHGGLFADPIHTK
jgi:hypothetical protein